VLLQNLGSTASHNIQVDPPESYSLFKWHTQIQSSVYVNIVPCILTGSMEVKPHAFKM